MEPGAVGSADRDGHRGLLFVAISVSTERLAWELIGGPSIGFTREVTALVLSHRAEDRANEQPSEPSE